MMFYVFSCHYYWCFTVFLRHLWFLVKNFALSHRHAFLRRPMCISCVLLLPRLDLLVFYSILEGRVHLRVFVYDYTQNGVFVNCSWICSIVCVCRTYIHDFNVFYSLLRHDSSCFMVFYALSYALGTFFEEISAFASKRVSSALHVSFVRFASAKARFARIF